MTTSSASHVYVLHTRKYRDTSILAEIFSKEEGRYSVVVRGARGEKSRSRGLVQPFIPLQLTLYGKGELRSAGNIEPVAPTWRLEADNLLIGMYVNELLYRVLGRFDSLPAIFERYEQLLAELAGDAFDLLGLRKFELSLLAGLGYGISFDVDTRTGEALIPDVRYRFVVEQGFHSVAGEGPADDTFSGEHLLRIASGDWSNDQDSILKYVIRRSMHPLLGGKPLNSRNLFMGRHQ